MGVFRTSVLLAVAGALALAATGCRVGPSTRASFERNFTVNGPTRLEINNSSGEVIITGSTDGVVHIRGQVEAYGMGFDSPQKRVDETMSNIPVEQKGDTIRVGKHASNMRNVKISYRIEVPQQTEVTSSVVSGSQTITGVRGPVKAQGASGNIRVENVQHEVQISSLSGSLEASDVGDDLRVNGGSGEVKVHNTKGDVRIAAISGSVTVKNPGGRVDVNGTSGTIDLQGATGDVKAHSISGEIQVSGDPGAQGYWELKTVSGSVKIKVPGQSNFRIAADSTSGEIRANIPIVIEEQGKHSMRAHVGNEGGRMELHTLSGSIELDPQ